MIGQSESFNWIRHDRLDLFVNLGPIRTSGLRAPAELRLATTPHPVRGLESLTAGDLIHLEMVRQKADGGDGKLWAREDFSGNTGRDKLRPAFNRQMPVAPVPLKGAPVRRPRSITRSATSCIERFGMVEWWLPRMPSRFHPRGTLL